MLTPKLLLAIPAIRHLGLIHDIPGTYTIKAIELKVPPPPLCSKDVLKATQSCLLGFQAERRIHHSIDDAKPFCMTSPRRVPLPLLGKLEKEITRLTFLVVIEPAEEPTEWCAL